MLTSSHLKFDYNAEIFNIYTLLHFLVIFSKETVAKWLKYQNHTLICIKMNTILAIVSFKTNLFNLSHVIMFAYIHTYTCIVKKRFWEGFWGPETAQKHLRAHMHTKSFFFLFFFVIITIFLLHYEFFHRNLFFFLLKSFVASFYIFFKYSFYVEIYIKRSQNPFETKLYL